jgi:hypothetical protein
MQGVNIYMAELTPNRDHKEQCQVHLPKEVSVRVLNIQGAEQY